MSGTVALIVVVDWKQSRSTAYRRGQEQKDKNEAVILPK